MGNPLGQRRPVHKNHFTARGLYDLYESAVFGYFLRNSLKLIDDVLRCFLRYCKAYPLLPFAALDTQLSCGRHIRDCFQSSFTLYGQDLDLFALRKRDGGGGPLPGEIDMTARKSRKEWPPAIIRDVAHFDSK